jgi:hypothetical protein
MDGSGPLGPRSPVLLFLRLVFSFKLKGSSMTQAHLTSSPSPPSASASDSRIRSLLRQMIRKEGDGFAPLPRALLAECMHSHDIHLLGAINSILDMPEHVGTIRPKLEFRHILSFKMRYCERCIRDDPKSEWADRRHVAGWEFGRWVLNRFSKKQFQPSDLITLRQWLTQFYHKSPPDIRDCITRTLLADLLRERDIRTVFSDWEKLPLLRQALQTALAQKSRFF